MHTSLHVLRSPCPSYLTQANTSSTRNECSSLRPMRAKLLCDAVTARQTICETLPEPAELTGHMAYHLSFCAAASRGGKARVFFVIDRNAY